ncbi:hypothetical protein NVP1293O_36 [Vibrio phage 1.293.O._10N.261.52.E1]|nr:hypothetical protein NVP1293O_36 [Vibrio phage 1.293.O._10N.261.52.E1]
MSRIKYVRNFVGVSYFAPKRNFSIHNVVKESGYFFWKRREFGFVVMYVTSSEEYDGFSGLDTVYRWNFHSYHSKREDAVKALELLEGGDAE